MVAGGLLPRSLVLGLLLLLVLTPLPLSLPGCDGEKRLSDWGSMGTLVTVTGLQPPLLLLPMLAALLLNRHARTLGRPLECCLEARGMLTPLWPLLSLPAKLGRLRQDRSVFRRLPADST